MANPNKHGLSRTIDEPTKRIIRQNCGFGCVICGALIYEYDHVDPQFVDATVHDPSKMTLLCGQHHAKATRGTLSRKTIKKAMEAPFALREGFSNDMFDITTDNDLTIIIGGLELKNNPIAVEIAGEPIIQIKPPEEEGAPFRLSGRFFNSQGQETLIIVDNEIQVSANNWDVTMEGKVLIIREARAKIHLRLTVNPPSQIIINRLNMTYKGRVLFGYDDKFNLKNLTNQDAPVDITFENVGIGGFSGKGLAL